MPLERDPRPSARFVGDHLALDFLNTAATPAGVRVDWLRNGADLVGWLERAGAISADAAAKFRAPHHGRDLDRVAEQARALREWLRGFIRWHAGRTLGAAALAEIAPLNRLLVRDDSYGRIEAGDDAGSDSAGAHRHPLRRVRVRRWSAPEQLLQPIAEAIGDLVCHADFRRIRACEAPNCALMFLDKTKAGVRRWCSMAACGNRAKVATYRARASDKRRRRR
ncbi:MAG: CGNR zinc finger domain-containing protein [Alphaproteobacteria bacterium]|nr:CGNR zinc finger domain-containing protein [Alphaproteobacteria bacterium]